MPHLATWAQFAIAGAVVLGFTIFLVHSFKKLCLLKKSRDEHYLGYFGECTVAEYLDVLKNQGYYVFHDLQCQDGGDKFNIDHVVVGSTGLFAIETKTRSKYWPVEDQRREQIEFDGKRVLLLRRSEAQPVRQAIDQAVWLSGQFNRKYFVQAILTFPGWEVMERKVGTAWVLSPEDLAAAICERGDRNLNSTEIDYVRNYLEKACRNVEY